MCPFSLCFGPVKSVPLSLLLSPSAALTGSRLHHTSHIHSSSTYVSSHGPPRSYILRATAFWSMKTLTLAFYRHSRPLQYMRSIFMSAQLTWLLLLIQQIATDEQQSEALADSRSIFVTAVKDEERIRFPEEVLLVQLVATELQHHRLLKIKAAINKVSCHLFCWDVDHRSCAKIPETQEPSTRPHISLR